MAVESSTKLELGKGNEFRIASASTGLSLSTTAAFQQFPLSTGRVLATPTTFSTAVVAKLLLNPWLVVLKTVDGMANEPIDYSNDAQDNDTGTSVILSSLDTLANGDFLLVGSHVPFRGVYFDVDGTNTAGSATVTVSYWSGAGWTTTGANVAGIRTTAVWDKDGIVTWTVPTSWARAELAKLYPEPNLRTYYSHIPLYWTRWDVDAAITDTSVTVDGMYSANRSTAYAELTSGQMLSADVIQGIGGIGCLEALTDAGTAKLLVNAVARGTFA